MEKEQTDLLQCKKMLEEILCPGNDIYSEAESIAKRLRNLGCVIKLSPENLRQIILAYPPPTDKSLQYFHSQFDEEASLVHPEWAKPELRFASKMEDTDTFCVEK